ncbi:hypothetical protein [Streptomyces yangpuensis]|uniref:hypothetical protein n=1 Tax=Streptomyces yangpuensis TaxID=1648182 RepID=UPI003658BF7F
MNTPTPAFTDAATAPTPYAAGLSEGRADAATVSATVTAARSAWISEFTDPAFAEGYRAGLTFDNDLERVLRTRLGRP